MHWFCGFVLVFCYPQYCVFLILFCIFGMFGMVGWWMVCLCVFFYTLARILAVSCECMLYLVFITILPAVTNAYIFKHTHKYGILQDTSRTMEMDFSFFKNAKFDIWIRYLKMILALPSPSHLQTQCIILLQIQANVHNLFLCIRISLNSNHFPYSQYAAIGGVYLCWCAFYFNFKFSAKRL